MIKRKTKSMIWTTLIDLPQNSFLISGILAIILSWVLTGCRFGNNVETPAAPEEDITGYYRSQPQGFGTCVKFQDNSDACNFNVSLSLIPEPFKSIISDPLVLQLRDSSTGLTLLWNPFGEQIAFKLYLNKSDKTLKFETEGEGPFWNDSNCKERSELKLNGKISSTDAGQTYQGLPMKGRVALTAEMYSFLSGDCKSTLKGLFNCYTDFTQCGKTTDTENQREQRRWRDFFDPYILSRVMTDEQITQVMNLGFAIIYE